MKQATQKDLLENIRDEFIENWIANNVSNGCSIKLYEDAKEILKIGFDKGAEEMAKIKDAQIERLTVALEYYNEISQ